MAEISKSPQHESQSPAVDSHSSEPAFHRVSRRIGGRTVYPVKQQGIAEKIIGKVPQILKRPNR